MGEHHAEVLAAGLAPEPFVRRALAIWLADLRELALLGLADWERTEIVSPELFAAVAGLQRPSFGSWNGLLSALRNARKAVLRSGTAQERERVERAHTLSGILAALDENLGPDLVAQVKPLAELTKTPIRTRARVADALPLPIALRNRIEHDLPEDPAWWSEAARVLRPLVEWQARGTTAGKVVETAEPSPPWFTREGDAVFAMNGLAADFSVNYVSRDGKRLFSEAASGPVLRSFQRLLGKAEAQERDVKAFLAKAAPEELKGVLLGDFLVGKSVGSGGFATVHKARQLSTGRRVALKILHDGMPEETRVRFRHEVEFLSRFDHPHIVGVLASGEETWSAPRSFSLSDEEWFREFSRGNVKTFIALEWVDGGTVEEALEGPHALATRVRWFREAALALGAVHAAGLVHRDVKPSNLMLRANGSLVLMDFGIARSHGEARTLVTTTGRALGTPAYMSPEQLRAADADLEVGPSTDIYSLCGTFYEVLTRQRLYGHDRQTAEAVKTQKLGAVRPESPRRLVPQLPWELDVILLGGLEPEVADRYASMEALDRDIAHFEKDEAIEYRRPSLPRRARLAYRRNRTLANVVLGFFAVAALGVALYVASIRAEQRRTQAALEAVAAEQSRTAAARDAALTAEASAKVESHRARYQALSARVALAGSSLTAAWDLRRRELLAFQERAGDLGRVIVEAAAVYSAARTTATLALSSDALLALAPGERADAARLARRVAEIERSALELGRCAAGELAPRRGKNPTLGSSVVAWCCAFSPDGREILAAWGGGFLATWSVESGEPVRVFSGHSGRVMACAFAPDGKEIVSGSKDGTLKLWDRSTGALLRTLVGHADAVNWCGFSPDGTEILSASYDDTLELWDRATGKAVRTFGRAAPGVRSCAFSPDGKEILASSGQALELWETSTGKLLRTFAGHQGEIKAIAFLSGGEEIVSASADKTLRLWSRSTGALEQTVPWVFVESCSFSPDGTEIVAFGDDGALKLWDRPAGALLRTFEKPPELAQAYAFSPDGKEIVAACGENTLRVWDRSTGALVRASEGHAGSVTACAVSPDGNEVVSASEDRTLKLWDRQGTALLRTFEGHTAGVWACAFSPDGGAILSGSADKTLGLWDRSSGRLLRTFEGHAAGVRACAFSPDGSEVLSGSEDRTLKLWDRSTGTLVRTLEGHADAVTACAFAPDGNEILSASKDRTLKLWDRSTGKLVRTFEGHTDAVLACAFLSGGTGFLSASKDKTLKLWNRSTGQLERSFERHKQEVTACTSSPDGRQIISASNDTLLLADLSGTRRLGSPFQVGPVTAIAIFPDGKEIVSNGRLGSLRLWDVSSGMLERTLEGFGVMSIFRFSPDAKEVLSTEGESLTLFDRSTGEPVRTLAKNVRVTTCAFSPDGRDIAAATSDNAVNVWDRSSGALVRTFAGHAAMVEACAFSPDGKEVLTGSRDKTLKLWDRSSGALVRTFHGHAGHVLACTFSPDGKEIVSASEDRTLKLWDRSSGALVRTLEGHRDSVGRCVFSPEGDEILSASGDRTLKLWDRSSGALLRSFEGHTAGVSDCAFSPDGNEILSASGDTTLKLWDRSSGSLLRTFEGHTSSVFTCAFTPDGKEIVSASGFDTTVRTWDRGPTACGIEPFDEHDEDPVVRASISAYQLQQLGTLDVRSTLRRLVPGHR